MINTNSRRLKIVVLISIAFLVLIPLRAHADTPDANAFQSFAGGLQLDTQIWNATSNSWNVSDGAAQPGVIKAQFDTAWSRDTPSACDGISADVSATIAQDATSARDVNCQLAAGGDLRVSVTSNNVELLYYVPGNVVTWYVTTPDVCVWGVCVGASRDLDPKFTMTFDAEIDVNIPVSANAAPLVAGNATVYVLNAHLDTGNVTGDLVGDVNAIITGFGGEGFFYPAVRDLDQTTSDLTSYVNSQLGILNAVLQQGIVAYPRMSVALDGQTLVVTLSRELPAAPQNVQIIVDGNGPEVTFTPISDPAAGWVIAQEPTGNGWEDAYVSVAPGSGVTPVASSVPTSVYEYRLCAGNQFGRSCSAAVTHFGSLVAAATKVNVTAPQPTPVPGASSSPTGRGLAKPH